MKKVVLSLALVAVLGLSFTSCKKTEGEGETAVDTTVVETVDAPAADTTVVVDTTATTVDTVAAPAEAPAN